MNEKLDKKLCKQYPKIFKQRNLPMNETAMCWGFQCDSGWYWLIDNLCRNIQSYIDMNPRLKIPQVEATTVKEKLGGLRFYIIGGDDDIRGKISFAEYLSYSICEICGSTIDVTQTRGWIVTLCRKCMKKRKEKLSGRVS